MICRRAALLCVALLLPASARASDVLQLQLSAAAGWSDNILSSATPIADFYVQLRPAFILTSALPRFVSRLEYVFTGDIYVTHLDAFSYNNRLQWNSFVTTSKTTDLLLSVSFTQGRLNTIATGVGSALTPITPTVNNSQIFASVQATEQFHWDMSPHWRLTQTVALLGYWPINPRNSPDTYDLDQHLITERVWRRDGLALDIKIDFAVFTQLYGYVPDMTGQPMPGVVQPERDVQVNGATLRWKHDFGHFWSTQLDLGFLESNLARGGGKTLWQPAALAAVRYLHPSGTAELVYSHAAAPNALVASVFVTDQALLRLALPLGAYDKTHLAFSASGGYQYARGLDSNTGGTVSYTHIALADATLSWAPRTEFSIYARYQFMDQIGNASGADFAPLPSFHKNLVMIGAVGTWPGEAAAVVPTREALRVDRGDAVTIPEPHSQPPKY